MFDIDNEQLKDGFNIIDTDNNNLIDFEEFMVWWEAKLVSIFDTP